MFGGVSFFGGIFLVSSGGFGGVDIGIPEGIGLQPQVDHQPPPGPGPVTLWGKYPKSSKSLSVVRRNEEL